MEKYVLNAERIFSFGVLNSFPNFVKRFSKILCSHTKDLYETFNKLKETDLTKDSEMVFQLEITEIDFTRIITLVCSFTLCNLDYTNKKVNNEIESLRESFDSIREGLFESIAKELFVEIDLNLVESNLAKYGNVKVTCLDNSYKPENFDGYNSISYHCGDNYDMYVFSSTDE